MNDWEFDLDLTDKVFNGQYIPFDVQYGKRKVSDFARKSTVWPITPGTLWERVAS